MKRAGILTIASKSKTTCACLSPYLGLSLVDELPINASKQKATFEGQSCPLDVISYDSCVCLASPQAGVKWIHCNGASIILGYKGLFNRGTRINQVEGRFEFVF